MNGKQTFADQIVELIESDDTTEALIQIASRAFKYKGERNWLTLSTEFECLSKRQIPIIVRVAILRHTFSVKQHIDFWNEFLLSTETLIRENHKNPLRYLYGLKKF